jgi:thiol-disulfide isomerase/thioredoxin
MKLRLLLSCGALFAATTALPSFAQETAAAPKSTLNSEVQAVMQKIQAKIHDGKKDEADFAPELTSLDQILAEHKDEKTDATAQVLMLKVSLYLQVFEDGEKALQVVQQLKADFPTTSLGQRADEFTKMIQKGEDAKKVRASLVAGKRFPTFAEKDVSGAPLDLASYRGKVVLVDFWATWCPPCRQELPNVVAAYQKFHDKGFEIVGISLDENRAALVSFTKEHQMPWSQYFDGRKWENKLAMTYGINSIPATFLLDGEGNIIATDLRGEDLSAELAKRLDGKTAQ